MFDETVPSTPLQRVHGRAAVQMAAGGRLVDLHQSGAAKALLPKMHGRRPEVVFLNTAGGVTGGDRLSYSLDLGAGATAVGTTQTAERAYRSTGGLGAVETHLSLGDGAELHWLPQEVILFEGAALDRRVTVDMPSSARLVMLECVVLGRTAMGETLRDFELCDQRRVTRDGRPAMIEAIRLGATDMVRGGSAGLNGAIALATLSLFAGNAPDALAGLRAVLPDPGGPVRAAASAWDGRVTARFAARDAFALRRAIAAAVPALTKSPLPRVWQI